MKLNRAFFDSFENISSYKIQQCIINPLKIDEEQRKSLSDNIESLNNILRDDYNKKYFESNKDKLKVLKNMYFDYKYELFKINNKEKLYKLKQTFIKSVKDIVKGWTGQNSIPTDIGLYNLYKTRLNFKNKLSRLKEKTYTKKINLKEYKMPVRGAIKIIKKQKSLPFDESWEYSTNEKKWFNNLKKNTFSNFLKLINFNLYESPKELFQSVVEEVETNMLVSNEIIFEDHDEKQIELSNGEKAFFTLMWKLEKENKDIFLLDEPGTFLDAKLIANELKDKLLELKAKQKTIVITTHLASLGINLLPMTFIYRRFNNGGEYDTYTASLLDEKFIHNKTKKTIDFRETIISNFEGGTEQFIFRKDIYGIKN